MNFYLSTFIFKYILLLFGLIGNSTGIIVFARRKQIDKKIPTKLIYQTILFINSIYLFTQILDDTGKALNFDQTKTSLILCKLRNYLNYL